MISVYLFIRKDSQRVPLKNFADVGGMALYERILKTVLKVGRVNEILINTDSADLLKSDLLNDPKIKIIHTIDRALDLILNESCDSVFGVTEMHQRFFDSEREPLNHDPAHLIPTQDLPPLYMENSALYLFRVQAFRDHGTRLCPNSKMVDIPHLESIDIDTEEDLILAKDYANYLNS
jgi:CMP-N-acetylneuraminic acid synthetase